MKDARRKKKKTMGLAARLRSRPFALLAFGLAVMTMALIVQLPRMMGGIDREKARLTEKMQAYSDLQSERNVLMSELERVSDKDYIEKIARREYGYGWYGETIYEIVNLGELESAQLAAEGTAD